MSKGVLILAHGSRRKSTEETLERVAARVREHLPGLPVQTAYMEFGEMNIERGLIALVGQNITEIAVVPYFLFDGVHIHEDIPAELAAFREKHPEIRVTMAKTLGADNRLADILADRAREVL